MASSPGAGMIIGAVLPGSVGADFCPVPKRLAPLVAEISRMGEKINRAGSLCLLGSPAVRHGILPKGRAAGTLGTDARGSSSL